MKKIVYGIIILIAVYLIYHYRSVKYGIEQASGQIRVITSSLSLEEYLSEKDPPDSILNKLALIKDVKRFSEEELGLKKTDNYQKIFDQNGQPILWVVTASPEFELKAYEWKFPIAGKFSYKGFFELEKAQDEADQLKKKGFDVKVDEVSAWSTLGWLSDPILTSMLEKDSGRLTELIIHELFHATIYLKDSVELNENLASFIGRKGAESYLKKIGDQKALNKYLSGRTEKQEVRKMIHRSALSLDSLYKSFEPDFPYTQKKSLKEAQYLMIRRRIAKIWAAEDSSQFPLIMEKYRPNNASFTGFLTYRSRSDNFEIQLEDQFNGNLPEFIQYYIKLNS